MRFRLILFFIISLLIIPVSIQASEKTVEKDWLLYFKTQNEASLFSKMYEKDILGQSQTVVKSTFTLPEMRAILRKHKILKVEENLTKQLASDPLYKEQWGLSKIAYEKTGLSILKTPNLLLGKRLIANNEPVIYEEKAISAQSFILEIGETKIRRLSIELQNPNGKWTAEVKDENNQLLAKNTSSYKRIDLLIPKNNHSSTLFIDLKSEEGWITPPMINKITGVNSSLVAIIDSGVIEHEDFGNQILYSLGKDYREGMDLPKDTNGHGTHVAGIIAADHQNGVGIAGAVGGAAVDLIPLKVLGSDGLTDDFALSQAVEDAIKYGVDVINISIAGKGSTEIFEKAVEKALQSGIAVVVAAGNGGESTKNVYPANFPGVITVSGIDQNGNKVKKSNYGWEVDISAPGLGILSTYTTPSYKILTGTSMAAPFVTSAIAYYKSIHPELDFVQIRRLLEKTALDIGEKGYDIETGAGIVQFSNETYIDEKMDWLNVKNNQPLEDKQELIVGLSQELIGQKLVLFKDEKIFWEEYIDSMMEKISLREARFTLRDNSFDAVVVDESNRVIDVSSISLQNSDISTNNSSFIDVPKNHWAYQEITQAFQAKLVNGYPDGSFKPSESIGRRQSLMMMNRLFTSDGPSSISLPFKDVSLSTSGVLAILSGSEKGYIKGINGYFYPENKLTRGQMALILSRALKPEDVKTVYPFKDVPKSAEYFPAVQLLAEKGIITKREYFKPNETITRAQFAAMLVRAQKYLD